MAVKDVELPPSYAAEGAVRVAIDASQYKSPSVENLQLISGSADGMSAQKPAPSWVIPS